MRRPLVQRLALFAGGLALAGAAPVVAAGKPTPPAAAAPATPQVLTPKIPAGAKLKLFAVSYESRKDAVGTLLLNGVPLVTFEGAGSSGSSNLAASWLFAGTNTVELVTSKLPKPKKDDWDTSAPISVSLHGLEKPGFPEDENQLWKIEAAGAPGRQAWTFELPADQAPKSELTSKAAVLSPLTPADEAELTARTRAFLGAIQKGDQAALHSMLAFRLAEQAKIDGRDPKELSAQADEAGPMLRQTFGKAALPAKLQFTLVAANRVVWVSRPGGKPAIAVGTEEDGSSLDVYFAKIDGAWTLAR